MRRLVLALLAAALLFGLAWLAWLALASPQTRIRWRLEEMSAGFNGTRLAPCLQGVAEDWRHDDGRVDRNLLADLLRAVFFDEQDPQTGRFPLQAAIEPGSLVITLDEADPTRARAELVGVFSVLAEGEWSTAWRARITLQMCEHEQHGWQVQRSAHTDLQADGRFLGMH